LPSLLPGHRNPGTKRSQTSGTGAVKKQQLQPFSRYETLDGTSQLMPASEIQICQTFTSSSMPPSIVVAPYNFEIGPHHEIRLPTFPVPGPRYNGIRRSPFYFLLQNDIAHGMFPVFFTTPFRGRVPDYNGPVLQGSQGISRRGTSGPFPPSNVNQPYSFRFLIRLSPLVSSFLRTVAPVHIGSAFSSPRLIGLGFPF